MYSNCAYWREKQERTDKAYRHTDKMDEEFLIQTSKSVMNTKLYDSKRDEIKDAEKAHEANSSLMTDDTVKALNILREHGDNGKIALLCFASYKNPGGRFLNGSSAQEESLCHESNLYNILRAFESENTFNNLVYNRKLNFDNIKDVKDSKVNLDKDILNYYSDNRKNVNKSLYNNRALYVPDVAFNDKFADVIVCAAPNYKAASKNGITLKENLEALKSRCEFVIKIAEAEKVDTLVLGAFGCGVFGQEPEKVVKYFDDRLKNTSIRNVVYAVPNNFHSNNYNAFKNYLDN